jgi:hypothetical protein
MDATAEMSGDKKLSLVVLGAIVVAVMMVVVGLVLYYRTGAYRADSSRVGADRPLPVGDNWEFEAVGPLDQRTFQVFVEHFDINLNAVRRHNF